ncbi:MAG: PQQ-dependent sugar dehydrogenase [Chloroflexi bacterium]|nr:PQQ-dependent sugar dehydrogenase [Chloroflexota bacterium]
MQRRFSLLGAGLTLALLLTACGLAVVPTSTVAPPIATPPPTATARPATVAPAPAKPAATTAPAATAPPRPTPPPPPTPGPTAVPTPAAGAPPLALERVVANLDAPLNVQHAGDGSGRLFILEKIGRIRIARGGELLPEPFLDIIEKVSVRGAERGLLGLVFHPQYTTNGLFYINYTDVNGDTMIVRYQVAKGNPDRADPTSAKTILFIKRQYPNHNGGQLVFGPDGYLWIGTGDGGGANDPHDNGQNTNVLLGKMLRIDVDRGDPYAIPPDNPFVNRPGYRPEIWAYGLRNPWRFNFDRATGDLYIGDVGQNRWEEVSVAPAGSKGGLNFGWSIMEGNHCFKPTDGCDERGLTAPAVEYAHSQGCSVTAGHVYRGRRLPALVGTFIYGDFCTGRVWGLTRQANGAWVTRDLFTSRMQISSLGEDADGELLVVSYQSGEVYRLIAGS